MLSIRLSRVGKKNQPLFRLIVVDKRKDPWGKAVEILGERNPRTKATTFKVDRIKHWMSKGAQPTATVWNILMDLKLVEGKKQSVTNITGKRRAKLAAKEAEKKAAAPAEAAPAETPAA